MGVDPTVSQRAYEPSDGTFSSTSQQANWPQLGLPWSNERRGLWSRDPRSANGRRGEGNISVCGRAVFWSRS